MIWPPCGAVSASAIHDDLTTTYFEGFARNLPVFSYVAMLYLLWHTWRPQFGLFVRTIFRDIVIGWSCRGKCQPGILYPTTHRASGILILFERTQLSRSMYPCAEDIHVKGSYFKVDFCCTTFLRVGKKGSLIPLTMRECLWPSWLTYQLISQLDHDAEMSNAFVDLSWKNSSLIYKEYAGRFSLHIQNYSQGLEIFQYVLLLTWTCCE